MQEVSDAYRGIEKVKRAYEGILKNPNLDLELRGLFQSRLDNIINYIERINALFSLATTSTGLDKKVLKESLSLKDLRLRYPYSIPNRKF